MKTILLAAVAAATLGATVTVAESAPIRTRVYVYPPGMTADEVRDYRRDQMERRHEMEREALEFDQRVERRALDPDD